MSGTGQRGRWEFDAQGNCRFVPEDGSDTAQQTNGQQQQWQRTDSVQHRQTGNTSHATQNKGDFWQWALIIGLFCVGGWPIAVILLILKAKGIWGSGSSNTAASESWQNKAREVSQQARAAGDEMRRGFDNARRTVQDSVQTARENARAAQRQNRQAEPDENTYVADSRQKKRAWRAWARDHGLGNVVLFRTLGALITGIFGLSLLLAMTTTWDLATFLVLLSFTAGGVSLLGLAGIRGRKLKRYQRYLTMIGTQDEISVRAVAKTLGYSEKRVTKDFQDMLDRGVFERGYLDAERDMLVLREWIPEQEPFMSPEDAGASADASKNASVAAIRRIREINNNIADPEMSDKIDRIEALTAKILRLLEENPDKEGELRSFLSYYLPETMDILDRYAKLEAQGVDRGNIAAAKQQIEDTTDKLVTAYEKQLDKLFESDAMDISADLQVMETMLEKDGLTGSGLHL